MKMIYGQNMTNKFKHLFRTAHYISLSKLDKAKGVDIGESYLNKFSISPMFIDFIAQVERQKHYNDINRSSFISVLSDGSTDISSIEQGILFE